MASLFMMPPPVFLQRVRKGLEGKGMRFALLQEECKRVRRKEGLEWRGGESHDEG